MADRNDEFLALSKPAPQEENKEDNNVLVIKDLFKSYGKGKNKKEVLKGLNLTVNKGEVFGFIGKNGIGKSTTIDCIIGLKEQRGVKHSTIVRYKELTSFLYGVELLLNSWCPINRTQKAGAAPTTK